VLTLIGERVQRWASAHDPWTNVYGVGRSMLAVASAITLATTHSGYLFVPGGGSTHTPNCDGAASVGLFCVASAHLEVARWLAVIGLLVVASGWRPRWTALLHWMIAFSIQNNVTVVDGGDAAALSLATLLLPIALTDDRRWHWQATPPRTAGGPLPVGLEVRRIVALFGWSLLRLQVCVIYFHAAIGKFAVEEWVDGTALWYFATNRLFGMNDALLSLSMPIFKSPILLPLLTWGSLILESFLAAGLLMKKRYRGWLLAFGIVFHAGIILMFGLVSFAITMFAALIVYLRPFDRPFRLESPVPALLTAWARIRQRVVLRASAAPAPDGAE
jgi:antimicrobial peptide system SdpB family protein